MIRVLIYTAVFGQYDRVLPPLWQRTGLTYHLLTDDPTLTVDGWETVVVSLGRSAKASNRELKFIYEVGNPQYDYLIYLDGNFGIWRSLDPLIEELEGDNVSLGLFEHPDRTSVFDELLACLESGKITKEEFVLEEKEIKRQLSSREGSSLWTAGFLIKKNSSPALFPLMKTWSELFSINSLRDQFWLGEAIYRSGARIVEFNHYSNSLFPRLVLHRHRKSERWLGAFYFHTASVLMSALRSSTRKPRRKTLES